MQPTKEFIESLEVVEFDESIFFSPEFTTGVITIMDKDLFCLWLEGDAITLNNPEQYENIRKYTYKE